MAYYGITQSLSFDGESIADEDTPVVVLDLQSGVSTVAENVVHYRPGILAFSRDGRWLSVQREGHPNSICVSRADGSQPKPLADGITLGTFDYPDPWR